MNCVAKVTADKCEVWVATQNGDGLPLPPLPGGLRPAACQVRGLQVAISAAALAGAGHAGLRHQGRAGRRAGIARRAGEAIWSREEDMRQGRFRPVGLCKMSAGLDDKGDLVGLSMRIAAPSILAYAAPSRLENGKDFIAFQGLNPQGAEGQFGYTVPNLLIEHAMRNTHVPPGFWRGVNTNQNAIWLECFMDELAKRGRQGPAGIPPQDDGQASQAPGRPRCGGRQDRLGHAPAGRRHARYRPVHGLRQLRRLRGRGARQRSRQGGDRPSRALRPTAAMSSTPTRSWPRSRAPSPTASAPRSTRSAR